MRLDIKVITYNVNLLLVSKLKINRLLKFNEMNTFFLIAMLVVLPVCSSHIVYASKESTVVKQVASQSQSNLPKVLAKNLKPIITQRFGNVVTLVNSASEIRTSTATCALNEVVTGGGYIATANFDIRKEVKNGNSWQIDVIGETGSQFQTVAECLKIG